MAPKVEMTTPRRRPATPATGSSDPEAPNFANLLKQLISLQAQLAAPTTNLSFDASAHGLLRGASLRSSGLMISGSA